MNETLLVIGSLDVRSVMTQLPVSRRDASGGGEVYKGGEKGGSLLLISTAVVFISLFK